MQAAVGDTVRLRHDGRLSTSRVDNGIAMGNVRTMMHERLNRLRRGSREDARCALITGASGGIGAALARELPAGTRVLLTGRDGGRLAQMQAELGERARVVVADLGTADGIGQVAEAADAAGVDLLVNNAGLGAVGDFLAVDFERHRETLRVNVEALMALTHRLLPGMVSRAELDDRRAGLINIASSVAFFPVPAFATYAASKALVLSFSEALAAELAGKPIDVLCACPGAVRTGFGSRAGFAGGSMPGAMSPEKVARATYAALGRQTTVVIGTVSAPTLSGVALARSLFGQGLMRAKGVMERVQNRDG